jgi:hypothetical protein
VKPKVLDARYTPCPIPELAGNPFVEALGPMLSRTDWALELANLPAFDPAVRECDALVRGELAMRMHRTFVPLPCHTELAERIARAIRQGYQDRRPDTPERAKLQEQAYERLHRQGQASAAFGEDHPINTLSVFGFSGMGKSTTVERILGCVPQVLYHPDYGLHQITRLKVDCPRNGSLKALAKDFVCAIDRALGASHLKTVSRNMCEDDIISVVQSLIVTYSVGILVVDEIQNLSVKKSGGREAMLNFFQELTNTLKIPVVLMGTNKAFDLLGGELRIARRTGTLGTAIWNPLDNDPLWEAVVERLLEYQWVKEPIEFTREIADFLHDQTQGVLAILNGVLALAQQKAISTGEETLSKELIAHVLKTDMAPVEPMLKALRSKDTRKLMRFDDLAPVDVEELMERNHQTLMRKHQSTPRATSKDPTALAIATLVAEGFERSCVVKAVTEVTDSGVSGVRATTERAYQILAGLHEQAGT